MIWLSHLISSQFVCPQCKGHVLEDAETSLAAMSVVSAIRSEGIPVMLVDEAEKI
jgi:uncharacterized protein YbaR (Trm112 family)